ncbi:MAG: hypothetical protein L3K19_05330 [Thermoplasmata archaeon]|nr:hypothetical protein [Thermoplasmata archaeon]
MDLTDPATYIPILFLILIALLFLIAGLFLITENEVGILTRRMFGTRMPPGQVIARHGQVGVQATTLMPGLYWRMPIIWNIKKAPVIEVGEANTATIESIDGRPLPKGRLLGDEVECNQFQDAEKFLDGGGFKGPQVGILRPGKYRINTLAFTLKMWTAAQINAGQVGIITAQDGRPLPTRLIVAPPPMTAASPELPHARNHNYFQDGPAFLDSGGYRGPQQDTLQPGRYYINPLLFNVDIKSVFEVPPGFVAVLRSNIGEELEHSDSKPTPISDRPDFDQTVHSAIETILTVDRNRRGIWQIPVAPGKYNLNPVAFTAYLVPTSAIMVDWASSQRPNAPEMSRPSTAPMQDTSSYPYLTDQTAKGVSFFQFSQLKVTSKDGFQLEVDVRMVIRILPENAAFIIARFGSVFNLIQQIVHPLIDSSFRNNAGEKKALEFVQGRSQLQQEALEKARTEFAKYMVEAQNLLISYIAVDESLLATQTQKEIAMQQQAQYQQQALAEEQRIAVQEKTARANLQPQVVQAVLQVEINENEAKALVKQAEGIRDSTRIKADGEGAAVRTVGQAQADAYLAQATVIGPERVALVRVMEQVRDGQIRITPDTLVATGGDGSSANTMITAYLATLLAGKSTAAASSKGAPAPSAPNAPSDTPTPPAPSTPRAAAKPSA